MIYNVPLPTLNERGELVLPSTAGGSAAIDICRVGGLGLTGVGAVFAMYGIVSGLVSTGSNPNVILVGCDEDFTLLTGLETERRHVPGRPECVFLQTREEVMEFAGLEMERRSASWDEDDPPWFIVLALSNNAIKAGLRALPADAHLNRFGAILVGTCPTGLTCVLDADGQVEKITGGGTELSYAPVRNRLGQAIFAQSDIEHCAQDFVAYVARVVGHRDLPWDGGP